MKTIIPLLLILFSGSVFGIDNPMKVGWSPWYGSLSVDDPDGDTDSTTATLPLSAMFFIPSSRDYRWVVSGFGYDFKLAASPDNIGQEVNGYSLAGWFQRRFRFGRSFKPWFGLGLQADILDITARHNIDSSGFLTNTYPDRSETGLGMSVNFSNEWNISKNIDLGLNAQYIYSFSNTLTGPLVGVSLLYRFSE